MFCGVLLMDETSGRILLLRRSKFVSDPGFWGIPGGGKECMESELEAAVRELVEEAGPPPLFDITGYVELPGAVTFLGICSPKRWKPKLNDENSDAGWFSLWRLPQPMHPGALEALDHFGLLR